MKGLVKLAGFGLLVLGIYGLVTGAFSFSDCALVVIGLALAIV